MGCAVTGRKTFGDNDINWIQLKKMEKPEQIVEAFIVAWNAYDAVRLADLFAPDADFVNVTGLWWQNKKAIYKAHEYGLRIIFNTSRLTLRKLKIRYLSEEVAVIHARMQLSGQSALLPEEEPQKRNNLFVFVVQKINNTWLCMAAQNTEIQNGQETFITQVNGVSKAVNYKQFKKD